MRGLDLAQGAGPGDVVSRDLEVFYPENRFLNFYIVPLISEDAHKELVGRAIILRDITQNRRATRRPSKASAFPHSRCWRRALPTRSANPLNSLDIHLQLMQRRIKKLPAKTRLEFGDSIQIAQQEAARLDHTITQFLRAIRPQPLTMRLENANVVVEESVAFLTPRLKKIVTSWSNSSSTGLFLRSRWIAIRSSRLCYNVIRNALLSDEERGHPPNLFRGRPKPISSFLFRYRRRHDRRRISSRVFEPYLPPSRQVPAWGC